MLKNHFLVPFCTETVGVKSPGLTEAFVKLSDTLVCPHRESTSLVRFSGNLATKLEIGGNRMCLRAISVLSPCSMEPQHYFGTALNSMTCFHLTILRHQNIKMSISKLNKNGWVLPSLCFLVPVRMI